MIKAPNLFLLFCGFVLSVSPLRAADLQPVSGTIQIKKAGSQIWTNAKSRVQINDGDSVRTGDKSKADLKLKQGHKVALQGKTTLIMESADPKDTRFSLIVGRVRAFVSKLRGNNKFQMKTPVAVASVRGTVFEMEVGEDNTSRLSVLEGIVGYRDLAGLGSEVSVLKGQSVVVETGAAPKPPEPLPADMRQGVVPDQSATLIQSQAASALKTEIQRETGLANFKEFFQRDAAQEMKVAQYQEGKTIIDAFGKRVRIEEYISRPSPTQWSFVSLNTREDRSDFTRFDLFAHAALPEDISTVNLFNGTAHDSMTNWVERTHRLSSNGGDYYREWQDGGSPVNMTDPKGNKFQLVVFDHWFTEVKAEGAAPTLLSHWTPKMDFKPLSGVGNPNVTKDRDDAEIQNKLIQDIPSGYDDYGTGVTRPIDAAGFTNAQRLDYFNNSAVANSYKLSEGYMRDTTILFDNRAHDPNNLHSTLTATKISRLNTYTVPGGSEITLRVDKFTITDEGKRLTFLQAATLTDVKGINDQQVFSSSLIGKRNIDVIVSPSIFKKAGLRDN